MNLGPARRWIWAFQVHNFCARHICTVKYAGGFEGSAPKPTPLSDHIPLGGVAHFGGSLNSSLVAFQFLFSPGSNTRSRWRFNALMMPMRANNGGPSCSATSNSASIAACHSSASYSVLGSLVMYRAASRNVQQRLLSARQYDRIEKPLISRHELHLPLIGDATRNMGSKHF